MQRIPDFKDSEIWVVQSTLKERYNHEIETELAESELRLRSTDRELTVCPVIYWEYGDCHFVIFKTGERKYRCQFFYRLYQTYGTGVDEFDDLAECTVTLLQTQADYEAKESGAVNG